MTLDANEIMKQAQLEIEQEKFREAVERAKQKIRERRSIWDRIFPFRIIFMWKEVPDVGRK